ncbi:IS4 family transposase [Orenia metallireducens]|uniref:Transposase, IS4 family n=1 Tax=Orenia metallireducens TaxID=1413210 RepID=A0A285GAP0_9FIRM|nr:IS4 family transposase [Orenia metallireducens]PRX13811.1 IS4 family transposase [Orenia metallireducens]SNY19586.1 transposase, IS4 family [Orenia metallireducens]
MNNCTILLNKFLDFIDKDFFRNLIDKYNSDYKAQKLTTEVHLLYLLYYHLTEKDSLEDFVSELKHNEQLNKSLPKISKSQLSRKNESRNNLIFFEIFQHLFNKLKARQGLRKSLKDIGLVKIIDSSTVSLCLSLFPWAKFRKNKGGIKLHTVYDLNNEAPENILITNAIIHDKEVFDKLKLDPSVTYLFDRAYIHYEKFDQFIKDDIYFVTRAKSNTKIEITQTMPLTTEDIESNILLDANVMLGDHTSKTRMKYPMRLVMIKTIDRDNKEKIISILTNRFDLEATVIAELYKERWQIELFFKWIKQHLKIKRFFGQNENAVLIQIYTAIILFLILTLIKRKSRFKGTLLELTRKIKYSIFRYIKKTFNWLNWLNKH